MGLFKKIKKEIIYKNIEQKNIYNSHIDKKMFLKNIDDFNERLNSPYGCKENNGDENIVLSKNICLGYNKEITKRNNNILVIGGAGTGKGISFVMPNLLSANANYVLIDDGSYYIKTKDFFIEKGYKIKVFDYTNHLESLHYNPLKHMKNELDVSIISKKLIEDEINKGDPFFINLEELLLNCILNYMRLLYDKADITFKRLFELLKYDADYLIKEIYNCDNELIKKQVDIICSMGSKTLFAAVSSLASKIYSLAKNELYDYDEIDFDEFRNKKTILYIMITAADFPPSTISLLIYQLYNHLTNNEPEIDVEDNIFLSMHKHRRKELQEKINNAKELKYNIHFILDEFAMLSQIPNLNALMIANRNKKINFSICIQNISQIKGKYSNWKDILEYFESILFLGGFDLETQDFICSLIDKQVMDMNSKVILNTFSYLDFREFPMNKCLVLIKGEQTFLDEKYNPREHKNTIF